MSRPHIANNGKRHTGDERVNLCVRVPSAAIRAMIWARVSQR
jgi:hypothetical protein